VKKFHMRL